jgi:uncharacterized OsmC-like protein
MVDGYACDIADGPWTLRADMSDKHGGNGTGPNPGVYVRGALASCLLIGYVRHAAVMGIPIDDLEVIVHSDYDARGEFGLSDDPPGYIRLRVLVSIDSPAPRAELLEMLDLADQRSSVLDDFRRSIDVVREVRHLFSEPA